MQPARKFLQPDSVSARAYAVASIRDINAAAWNTCFPGELENYEYLLATEEAKLPGFAWRYIVVEEGGDVLAAMPAFLTDYPLDVTLEGTAKKIIAGVRKLFPRFLVLKLACLGSPVIECGYAGFAPGLSGERKSELLRMLLDAFVAETMRCGYALHGVKDVPQSQKTLWDAVAFPLGFRAVASQPTARLTIDFASVEEYLGRLSRATRKDMRRKLKSSESIRVERRTNIDDVLEDVLVLYNNTRARSELQFEELTAEYFSGVLSHMGEHAFCTLYYAGEILLAANILLQSRDCLIDKFFCMDGAEGRKHDLYFLSWFTNLQYCIDHRIGCYQSGQAGYRNKLRLQSTLTENWLLFRHASPMWNKLLRLVSPLLAMDEEDLHG